MQSDGSQYLDTLNPKYNSIDLTEVELPEVDSNPNNNAPNKEDEDTNMLLDVSSKFLGLITLKQQ